MGTLRKLKAAMKLDHDLRKLLVRGSKNEILIDIDGDKEADIALIDVTGNGDIDTVAFDLTGDGEFNLYIRDTDGNGIPDTVIYDDEESDKAEIISGSREETEAHFIEAAKRLYAAITVADYVASEIEAGLKELDKEIRKAKRDYLLGK